VAVDAEPPWRRFAFPCPAPQELRLLSGLKARASTKKDAEWTPALEAPARDREYRNWRKAVEKSFGWMAEGDG
jgi:glycerol kinase